MHIEFIDLFRCPRPHEETWLVAAFKRMAGRLVIEGKLGCPVCGAEYPIRNGVAVFGESTGTSTEPHAAGDSAETLRHAREAAPDEDVVRLAAMLGLSRPGMLVLLAGTLAPMSHQLSALASARVLTLNSIPAGTDDSETVASIGIGDAIPIASRSVDGIALDAAAGNSALLGEVSRVLKAGGRLVAPASFSLPAGLRKLARDELHVVAESVGELIVLGR